MDKSIYIKDMARTFCTRLSHCEYCVDYDFGYCKFLGWCDLLYNAGYRKIPEDSVLLSSYELSDSMGETWKQARNQAIKEFAHTLIKECELFDLSDDIFYVSLLKDIRRIANLFGVDL